MCASDSAFFRDHRWLRIDAAENTKIATRGVAPGGGRPAPTKGQRWKNPKQKRGPIKPIGPYKGKNGELAG
jgi:hypothetical protein